MTRTLQLSGTAVMVALATACTPAPRMSNAAATYLQAASAAPREVSRTAPPVDAGFSETLPSRIDSLMRAAIADGVTPGAAVAVGRHGRLVHLAGYGRIDWTEGAPGVTDSTLWDLASVTKVVATTTAAMVLEDQGRLDLDRAVREYLPEFDVPGKESITPRLLLSHRSGMETRMLYREAQGPAQYLAVIGAHPLKWEPGTHTNYSDWNMIAMQFVIERITGQPLDEFLQEQVFGPLGMQDTGYNPSSERKHRTAPTEIQEFRGGKVWGIVHDENAWAMGGVAGHAGLFSSARDLAVYAQMMLNAGEYRGKKILQPQTVARWTAPQGSGSSRALGWDTPWPNSSAGRYFSPWSFGHTGFTGTSIWIDPHADLFVLLLTSRVNPTRENTKIAPLRRSLADVVQEAIVDPPARDWERLYEPMAAESPRGRLP
jgi:CubicO group peptidase (beta-lactamase class C family)